MQSDTLAPLPSKPVRTTPETRIHMKNRIMQRLAKLALLIGCLFLGTQSMAQTTPKIGSPERKALMDTLRKPVEAELKRNVVFKVNVLNVQGDWAFMRGVPQMQNGARMDYSASRYQNAIRQGFFDDGICALWKRQGNRWNVVKYVIGATDVAYASWDTDFGAPKAILR